MVAIIADIDQAEAVSVDLAQDVLEQSGQLRRERRLPRLWHLAQIPRANALATAIQDRDGRGRSFLPFPVAHGHIDTIAAHGEGRLKPTVGRPGLMQPADDAIDLGRLAVWSHACTETRQEFAERGTRPRDAMVMSQHLQHVALGMIGSPEADAFRERGCRHTGFYTQAELQWVDRTSA